MIAPAPASLNWKAVLPPRPVMMQGSYVTLEPLDATRHSTDLWNAVHGRPEIWTWLSDGPYNSHADLHQALTDKQASDNALFFAILPNGSAPSAAGYASYMRMEPAHGVIEVGNVMLSPRLQRTRASTEAMYLMARHIFEDLGYRRYEWKCNARNEPSRRAALRLGFSFEGIFRQHMVIKDRNRDTAWFAMLDCEWPERKRAFEAWLDPANFDSRGQQQKNLSEITAVLAKRHGARTIGGLREDETPPRG